MNDRAERWRRPAVLRTFGEERHATWLELFFDLCFVAAVAALAAELHEDHSIEGLLRFAGLFLPVWWAWMGFTWYATAFDNDDAIFRAFMLAAMLAVIALAAGVSSVRDGESTSFVVSYAAMKFLLAGMYWRSWTHSSKELKPFCSRYGLANAFGAGLWLVSLLVEAPGRYWVWAVAMVVLMIGPIVAVRSYAGIAFDHSHITERYGLFTLIVLGESIVVVSAGLSRLEGEPAGFFVAAAAFLLAAGIWWVYFDFVKSTGLSRTRLVASFLWGYGHMFVFSGIAAAAVGVEFAIEAADSGHLMSSAERWILVAGLAAYMGAIALIQVVTVGALDPIGRARAATAVAACVLGIAGNELEPLALVAILTILVFGEGLYEIRRAAQDPEITSAAAE